MQRNRIAVLIAIVAPAALPALAAAASTGGTTFTTPASIVSVDCARSCAGKRTAHPGSVVRVRGRKMRSVQTIVFLGGRGPRDDVTARPRVQRSTSLEVRVPKRAVSGPLRAVGASGVRSRASRATIIVAPDPQAAPPSAPPTDATGHTFPIRGAHTFGEGAGRFGGGRGHKGQDVFAACGTRLVAARGGVVKFKQYQDRAGNYVVIDGEGTGVDYAYMHMRDPSPLSKGDNVRTGQAIGNVGETGRATGCHLHLEMWSAPGWYTGGAPFDPLPSLKAWDAAS